MKLYSLKKGLKRARKEAGLTQAELAEKYGVHVKTVMNWEQGIAVPSLETLMDLTELYHCDLDYLTGRIDCRTHDLQYIHDQTGLSEKAITKLQGMATPPDWDRIEKSLIESAPEIPAQKIHDSIQRRQEDYDGSAARDYHRILSLLIEDINAEYLLYLITTRVTGSSPRPNGMDGIPAHKDLINDDLYIDMDGQRILTHKSNMLDSLIQSEIASMIHIITAAYHKQQQ